MNAFVTGGSRGIGRAIVLRYVQEGWGVAFTYGSNDSAAKETIKLAAEINPDVQVKAYQMPLQDAAAIEDVCDQALFEFKEIHAVVNNAAMVRDNAAIFMSNEEWDEVIQVNLTAPYIVARSFLMSMVGQKYGRLIFISSLSAHGSSGQVNYAASKAGLNGLSQTLAKEYGSKGVTSNVVTVGYVPTEMTKENLNQQLHDFWLTYCPAKREGKGHEIASTVFHLSGEDAGFLTGENIKVAGGLTYAP